MIKTPEIILKPLISCLTFLSIQVVNGQALRERLLTADSIVLISHVAPSSSSSDNNEKNYELIMNGKLNHKIIKEYKRINKNSLQKLTSILVSKYADKEIEEGKCFIPHHAILIYKKSKMSYIDICFSCREIETSTDIKIQYNDFDQSTWKKLAKFFQSLGFTYKLE